MNRIHNYINELLMFYADFFNHLYRA